MKIKKIIDNQFDIVNKDLNRLEYFRNIHKDIEKYFMEFSRRFYVLYEMISMVVPEMAIENAVNTFFPDKEYMFKRMVAKEKYYRNLLIN